MNKASGLTIHLSRRHFVAQFNSLGVTTVNGKTNMPQLKSWSPYIALSASPYLDALTSGPDESKYFAIVALRLNVPTPDALRDHLAVGYFLEGEGIPPDAQSYNSGYCVADVLKGHSD